MGRTTSTPHPLDPCAVALLRGGARGAVTVAVLGLHLSGAVEAGRPGTLRKAAAGGAGPFRHPLEKAVRTGLYRPAGPRELPARAVVRRALARMRAELVAEGLLRALPPGRTRAARRFLTALREHRPLPEGPDGLPQEELLLCVALYGERALTALVPRFAREAGLTGPGALADEGLFPFGRGADFRRLYDDEAAHGWDGDDREAGSGGHEHGTGPHGGGHHGGHDHGGHGYGGGHHGGHGYGGGHDHGGGGCGGGGF
ncbi:TIGR04222 domain-containing membrane protein [Streptomyces sp. 5-8]|uniref:TIGR04222 domain-containing membrane protein n=2 Tax=Streptomyces musisoli TaxID=2802280 RepID=A0ABS1NU55_9ACTN|nr:TIGR04222 domain-containing membrane protein [Streptomyces sp. SP2-10]MBL1103558.1 TIGR04222 domain-containing membrane protein [Streptomyces musisoli]MBY8839836.1 TIGR04222 domain-containing membrane protein [Streptomyces sp. SP2-10]